MFTVESPFQRGLVDIKVTSDMRFGETAVLTSSLPPKINIDRFKPSKNPDWWGQYTIESNVDIEVKKERIIILGSTKLGTREVSPITIYSGLLDQDGLRFLWTKDSKLVLCCLRYTKDADTVAPETPPIKLY